MPDSATGLCHVEHGMGTVFSFDIRDQPTPAIRRALAEAVHHLHQVDAVCSTYRPDSHISRLDRGEIHLDDCPPEVHQVLSRCAQATHASDGWFSVIPAGTLDPSGPVTGWATETASPSFTTRARPTRTSTAEVTCSSAARRARARSGASASPTRYAPANWPPSSPPATTCPSPPPAPPNAASTSSTRTPADPPTRSPPSPSSGCV